MLKPLVLSESGCHKDIPLKALGEYLNQCPQDVPLSALDGKVLCHLPHNASSSAFVRINHQGQVKEKELKQGEWITVPFASQLSLEFNARPIKTLFITGKGSVIEEGKKIWDGIEPASRESWRWVDEGEYRHQHTPFKGIMLTEKGFRKDIPLKAVAEFFSRQWDSSTLSHLQHAIFCYISPKAPVPAHFEVIRPLSKHTYRTQPGHWISLPLGSLIRWDFKEHDGYPMVARHCIIHKSGAVFDGMPGTNAKQNLQGADKALHWLCEGPVAHSSRALCGTLFDWSMFKDSQSHPKTMEEFTSCLHLMETVPEVRLHLDKMKSISPEWKILVKHWKSLEGQFKEESITDPTTPQTFEMMRALIEPLKFQENARKKLSL